MIIRWRWSFAVVTQKRQPEPLSESEATLEASSLVAKWVELVRRIDFYILWLGHGPHWRCIFEVIGVADFKASFSWFNCMFQWQILTKIALSQSGRDCLVCLELCGRPVPFFQNSKRAKCRQLSARISQPWEPGRHIPPERPGAKWTITKVDIRETILH